MRTTEKLGKANTVKEGGDKRGKEGAGKTDDERKVSRKEGMKMFLILL